MSVLCPECEGALDVVADELEEGQTLVCDDCGAALDVVSTRPVELLAQREAEYDEDYAHGADRGSDEE